MSLNLGDTRRTVMGLIENADALGFTQKSRAGLVQMVSDLNRQEEKELRERLSQVGEAALTAASNAQSPAEDSGSVAAGLKDDDPFAD